MSYTKWGQSHKILYALLPVVIGLSVVGYLFYDELDAVSLVNIDFGPAAISLLLLAFLLIILRDIGQILRFRIVTHGRLSVAAAFRVNAYLEFTSAVSPSTVGGSSMIPIYLKAEGIDLGRGAGVMISCLFLDELFIVLSCPIVFLFFSFADLFGSVMIISDGMMLLSSLIYALIVVWTALLFTALFVWPGRIRSLLLAIFRWRLLKRFAPKIRGFADELFLASTQLREQGWLFWFKAFGATVMIWVSRFMVVNALLLAFAAPGNQFIAFARQLVLWIVMTVSPTPGGSGIGEYIFKVYYADFFVAGGMAVIVALIWRFITCYAYLILGPIVISLRVGKQLNQKKNASSKTNPKT